MRPSGHHHIGIPAPQVMGPFVGTVEIAAGCLVLLGLFTRPAAFILAGDMAAAYFMAHFPRGFFPAANGGDAAILFCFVFLYLAAAGGGIWSLDAKHGR